jgi:hypothetical protein
MDTSNDFRIAQDGCLETLARRIQLHLKEQEFCFVLEDEVERCWPSEKNQRMERERQIRAFAKSCGWNVFILDTDSGRTRTIFLQQ